jgi:hypothetical protein
MTKYLLIENSDFWNKAKQWFFIDKIKAEEKFKGMGKKLLKSFINTLPTKSGVVLNATPLDNDISQRDLQNWYIKNGFSQISKTNISLYFIK